jgi:hypothetical protein
VTLLRTQIYFEEGERTPKGMEARLRHTHTHTDTYIPGGNKRKTKKKMRRESGSQGNESRMYMTQECVHDVKKRTKRCIMANSHDRHNQKAIVFFKSMFEIDWFSFRGNT